MNFIDFENTQSILENVDEINLTALENLPRTDISNEKPNMSNKFILRPSGILIQDSYNNPFFPIRPTPRLDTSNFNLAEVYKRYKTLYSGTIDPLFLPWHFCIEFIGSSYYVFSTRPVDMKFPLNNYDAVDRQHFWNDDTQKFINDNIFDINMAIHILVIGDSNIDVYTKKFYELLARVSIIPYIRYFKLPDGGRQRIFPLNMGKKFNFDYIMNYVRRK